MPRLAGTGAPPTPTARGSSRTTSSSPSKSEESALMGPPPTPRNRLMRGGSTTSAILSAAPTSRVSNMSATTSASAPPGSSPIKARAGAGSTRACAASSRGSTATPTGARSPVKKVSKTQGRGTNAFSKAGSTNSTPISKVIVSFPSVAAGIWDGAEPIKAFLRLRPALDVSRNGGVAEPYIEVTSDTDIIMTPPKDNASGQSAQRSRQAQHYSFNKIFRPSISASLSPSSSQAIFFQETCLPMITDLLNNGQSGLYCTYGVTNSGKSYTIHGGNGKGEAGVLPRTLDTIFNSLDGLLGQSKIRPVGLSGVEQLSEDDNDAHATALSSDRPDRLDPLSLPPLRKRLLSSTTGSLNEYEREQASVKVDRNYRYSVWISYLEVYNEKLYDLLDVTPTTAAAGGSAACGMSRSESVRGCSATGASNWSLAAAAATGGSGGLPSSTSSAAVSLTRHALPLKNDSDSAGDPEGQCKYAVGLSEHQVCSAEEARALIKRGEQNRAVFGTMANRVSSRSHGVFTVRVIREHGGEVGEAMYSTSRMSIVDLAGSERMANTQLTDAARMKEAGNINKSLMNLGHCLEKLRANQTKAQSLSTGNFNLTAKPEVVPFNSSKLTALLKTYFVGEGKTVMIITANPYDGGFYENAQVMKFSATVKDVQQLRGAPNAMRAAIPRSPTKISLLPSAEQNAKGKSSVPPVRISQLAQAQMIIPDDSNEGDITIIEESGDDDDEAQDPLVDLLITKCEELRQRLFAAETRCAQIEYDVRQEMADEMQMRLADMTDMWSKRMLEEEAMNEQLINKKLDLLMSLKSSLHRANDSIADSTVASSIDPTTDSESDADDSLVSAMGGVALASPDPTPLVHRSTMPALLPADDDAGDSMELGDSPLLRPGRLPPQRVAKASPPLTSSDDSQVEFVSADTGRQDTSSASIDSASISLDEHDEAEHSATEFGEDAADTDDEKETEPLESSHSHISVSSANISSDVGASSPQDEEESSIDDIQTDDPEDESFDANAAEISDDGESSFEARTAGRRSRASTATARRQSVKTPRASKAAKAPVAAASAPSRISTNSTASMKTPKPKAPSRFTSQPLAESSPSIVNKSPASMAAAADVSMSLDSQSNVSLIALPAKSVSPKKKRKLRAKSAVDEQMMVEQIGDSSLTEAVYNRRTR
ncbi:P-loop containing nucleoside triphosphate hydrolase protein [Tilletiaria anomala UBC 951]|uniref:p-loop containing nucleoside triphosphate hydrolase protein n=1 Tax=Tilletiaria anomala (strain ATCC 24038 / CBS 436.72 / UBC 951) TaxID=1037660 RepID=A0A066WK54_TILAU|nr:P-loop containing nucleoside triphosphate hydrolase protein [Tilletiaria anomala UBC 951]KDN52948.1 P-loop containing nucleoside triphosphate hydrolase protein [Tilletiaria anomala UBC 951]